MLTNAGPINCGMIGTAADGRPLGASLKHASDVAARILVIEDNDSDVFLLKRALNKQNFRFELVHLLNGGEAIAFIRRQGAYADAAVPNLILMDLNLSKYSGEDILREIRSAGHLDGVPVCVWSSSRSRRDEASSRTSEFPSSSPSLPVWINSWRSAKPSRICSRPQIG